jgi:hypothetical protein
MLRRTSIVLRLALAALALAAPLAGCSSETEERDAFYQHCDTADECPTGWVCPDPSAMGHGAVGNVCSPVCVEDTDCQMIAGRLDVRCSNSLCLVDCNTAADCPETQPICRGDNPSCEGQISNLFCSTADFSCD